MFSSYIDRQKSKVGSSEKSQKVHSANWKEEVQLRKELECLNRQEQQRVSRISIDQRLAVNRFHKKLSKSVLIAKSHEQAISDLNENRVKMEKSLLGSEPSPCQHMRTIRCLNAFPKPPVPKFSKRRSKSCEPPKKIKNNSDDYDAAMYSKDDVTVEQEKDLMPRPMTALEKRNRLWERQLNTVTQRINRARSAPAKTSFYKVPEFSQSFETFMKNGKSGRILPKQRGMAYTVDMDVYRYYREKQIMQQREMVIAFLRSIEPLELVPWTPYDTEHNDPNSDMYLTDKERNEEEKTAEQEDSRRISQTRRKSTYDKIDSRRSPHIGNRAPTKAWT